MKDNKVILNAEFINSQIVDSDLYIRWIPLILCWPPDKFLGISEFGNWVVEESNGVRLLDKANSFLRVKVLLENQLNDIRNTINKKLEGFNLDFDSSFPFKDLLEQVMKNDSEYWVEHALRWYDDIPQENKKDLKEALETIQNKMVLSQKIRHKAIKELARLRDNN